MAEAILEKQVCRSCGVDVRPDTQFCYNCGKSVSLTEQDEAKTGANIDAGAPNESLAELERALAASRVDAADPKKRLESAAAERRRARVGQRKPIEIVWEPSPDGSNRLYLLVAVLIFLLMIAVVFLTVFLK